MIVPASSTYSAIFDRRRNIYTPFTWYIMAALFGDAASNGITAAEFRLSGTPPGWFVNGSANPAAYIDIRPSRRPGRK